MKAYGLILAAVLAVSSSASGGELSATSAALITLEEPRGWSVGVEGLTGRRSFRMGDEAESLDLLRARAMAGASLLPFLHVQGSLGWTQAESTQEEAEGGLDWGLGADLRLLEFVLRRSRSTPGMESFQLSLRGEYRRSESHFRDRDFTWREVRAAPVVTYYHRREGEVRLPLRDYTGLAMHAGLVFSDLSGDLGDERVEGNRDFGLLLGVDWRWAAGWVTRFQAVLFGEGDREVGLGAAMYF